ncbi:MAG TPA: glycoside hydrolase family 9 protein [Tepidisphaeraceae bacterium]|jgi:endoglucanase|nr:glycoside hydrolase family 9 protein [Tepidisphaeraceae bacterium]
MTNPSQFSIALTCLAIWLISASAGQAMTVDEFRALPDNRIAVRTLLGLRQVRMLANDRIEAEFGASVGPGIGNPKSYRIISSTDPRYAFEKFVMPTEASVVNQTEAAGPAGCAIAKFERTRVTLKLPAPLLEKADYFLIAQGADGAMVTAGHSAAEFHLGMPAVAPASNAKATDLDLAVLGLRRVESVGAGILRLEFGPDFSTAAGSVIGNYTVTVSNKPAAISAIGRISRVDTYIPVDWPFHVLAMHDIFLQLSSPLADGDRVSISVAPTVTTAMSTAALTFDARSSISESLKVNQVGYLTDSPVKVAYLGRWMGSFPEKPATAEGGPALYFSKPPEFHLCTEADRKIVFTGPAKLIHRSGQMNEGVGAVDHSGENVYLLDFTAYKTPGRYFISVDGVGRSLPFDIGDDVYATAFKAQAYGVFAQRCGIELKPPFSDWRRIDCHDNGLMETSQLHSLKHDLSELPGKVVKDDKGKPIIIHASGGHHDAGDYNPRSHLDVAQKLMDAYEIAPQKFYDGQLNIPESGNGIPDILDEAAWAMKLWIGLQATDGGVHDGTESRGDPNFIQTAELDDQGDFAYAKDAVGSFNFAAAMAQASRIWRSLGKNVSADDYLTRARRAYEWALAHKPQTSSPADEHAQFIDPMAYAAAQLLHTTGEARYNADFLQACVWTKTPDAEIESWGKYDQSPAAWAYVNCDAKQADAPIQKHLREAIVQRAELYIHYSSMMAYGFIRHPWAPISWGTGAYENHLPPIIWAWKITGDEKYRGWIIRTCDNTLGDNPMGLSYVVGIGTRTVRAPLHNSRYGTSGEVVTGMQVEGPLREFTKYNVTETAWPKPRPDFALLNFFVDANFAIEMDEGMVSTQSQTMAVFGLLLKDHRK